MYGIEFACQWVSDYLASNLPTRIPIYETLWDLDPGSIPVPQEYAPYGKRALEHYPSIITAGITTLGVERDDLDDYLNPKYRVTYRLRTFVWTRSEGVEGVDQLVVTDRNRLTTVVRSALLDHPCLRLADTEGKLDIGVDETTMTEEYSDVADLAGKRRLAGSYLQYDITLLEPVVRDNLYTGEVTIEHRPEPMSWEA